ncbi:DUF2357 domain-containing protein [Celeribacter sp. PS-C1]|uniref:DUF2357 domain-containing protein n=1 Tax=Celeribacter sp. PS-C1 TaxID=2820813 RepID=UPI002102ED29|nr:DUF2357 domain-containing protein [Celeribacter sp. PS-C1]
MSEYAPAPLDREERVLLMKGEFLRQDRSLYLHPYPKRADAAAPIRMGFPVRPKLGNEPRDDEERFAHASLTRMNEVLARIQELEEALDDPENVWSRLREAWRRAENEEDPRMAEIVKQARDLTPVLKSLEARIRRVLRRNRELTPIDRVQEMDRASMVWLSRQPGRTVVERAGASQRILSTVRRENFDTLENRVLHAYTKLAEAVAREWLREHPRARESARYKSVHTYRKLLRAFSRMLAEIDVGIAAPPVTPNYVLMQDRGYRQTFKAWERLLRREKTLDELWAWQAQAWTDFAVLAIVLALDELDESELIAQSPVVWNEEAVTGRWFHQDRPLAVFWLKQTGRIVEVQSRPETPGSLLTAARAHVALRITDPQREDVSRRVAVWTPHAMEEINLTEAVDECFGLVNQIQQVRIGEVLRHGVIIAPAHARAGSESRNSGGMRVDGIALGASGESLARGMEAIRSFARSEIYREAQ